MAMWATAAIHTGIEVDDEHTVPNEKLSPDPTISARTDNFLKCELARKNAIAGRVDPQMLASPPQTALLSFWPRIEITTDHAGKCAIRTASHEALQSEAKLRLATHCK